MTTTTREDIARVVDPNCWGNPELSPPSSIYGTRQSEAFAKADRILALIAGEGWRVVPVEPTEAMLMMAEEACYARSEAEMFWSSMLSAAPIPEAAKEVQP